MRRFTPSEIEKIRFMASCGHGGNAIAKALDRTPQAVRVKAVELGVRLRPRRADNTIRISLDRDVLNGLRAVADAMGTTPTRLTRQLFKQS